MNNLLKCVLLCTLLLTSCLPAEVQVDTQSGSSQTVVQAPVSTLPAGPGSQEMFSLLPSQTVVLTDLLTPAGVLSEELILTTADSKAKVIIPSGTQIEGFDSMDQPELTLAMINPPGMAEEGYVMWGPTYVFSPQTLSLSQPAQIRICYDPPVLDSDKDENDPLMCVFHADQQDCQRMDADMDLQTYCLTAEILQFGSFGISVGIIYEAPVS